MEIGGREAEGRQEALTNCGGGGLEGIFTAAGQNVNESGVGGPDVLLREVAVSVLQEKKKAVGF